MNEAQADILIGVMFFILASQFKESMKMFTLWYVMGIIYMLTGALVGILRIFS